MRILHIDFEMLLVIMKVDCFLLLHVCRSSLVAERLANLDMTDRLSPGQQCDKNGFHVRLGCTAEVALEPVFVQRITKESVKDR